MRIAVLAHSAVKDDARISKEARSLRAAGHEVVIHGISPDRERHLNRLPDSDVPVLLEPRVSRLAQWRKRALLLPYAVLGIALMAYGLALVTAHPIIVAGHDLGIATAILWWGIGVACAYRARHVLARIAQHTDDFVLARWRRLFHGEAGLDADTGLALGAGYHRIGDALLRSLARRPAPDAIHIHDHVALVLAPRLAKIYGVPIVWDAHEIYQDLAGSDAARARENAAIIAACHGHIAHFITINESIARFYREHYPKLPAAVVVMNATLPEPVPVYDGRLHEAAGLPPTQKILLFQGRFSAHRGLAHLVEAAAALRDDWTLVMMGWGGLEAELRRVADRHLRAGAPATVFLPGVPQEQLQQWSAGASLGVVPYENTSLNHLYCTPNKLWEYPGAGVPVLCTDLPEMAAMLAESGYGLLLPREFSAADIARIVNALDETSLAVLRARCAPFIASNNWSRWEASLLEIYRRIEAERLPEAASPADGRAPVTERAANQ